MADKIKVKINKDEWYPVYGLKIADHGVRPRGKFALVTPEFYERYEKAGADFGKMQDELGELFREQTNE